MDLDIAIAPEAFGKKYLKKPSHNYVKAVRRYGSKFSGEILKKELEDWLWMYLHVSDLHASVRVLDSPDEFPDRDPQIIYVHYPSVLSAFPYQEALVKIKFKVRACARKTELLLQQDLLSVVMKGTSSPVINNSFYLKAVPLAQTMLEKIFMLQEIFMKKEMSTTFYDGKSRHIYDLVKMADKIDMDLIILDEELYKTLNVHNKFWFYHAEWRPVARNVREISLEPSLAILGPLMDDYRRMRRQIIFDPHYDFMRLIGRLKEISQKLSASDPLLHFIGGG